MIKKFMILGLILLICFLAQTGSQAAEKQVIAGAGPSTRIVELFFEAYGKLPEGGDYSFEIPPKSIKHSGGIKACESFVFGRTGRPLNEEEKKMNKDEIILGQIPVSIVAGSEAGIAKMTIQQLEGVVTGKIRNWKEIGGADKEIQVIGREETEAIFTILKEKHPFFKGAKFSQVFQKDEAIVNYMKSPKGKYAVAFGAKSNFENIAEVQIVAVEGLRAGAALGLVYDLGKKDHPLVKSVKAYAGSKSWVKVITDAGYLPPEG
ncbi:MAG: hypothetical protein C4530_19445 [Desulfobacteraceae bacterium]|nr:MAG: hypothetical protein C4530_19445 [Desulfobacteraceae bacterium]